MFEEPQVRLNKPPFTLKLPKEIFIRESEGSRSGIKNTTFIKRKTIAKQFKQFLNTKPITSKKLIAVSKNL